MNARLPVVDGDQGADIYGSATTAAGACRVARRYFADHVSHAECYGPISLREGGSLQRAWVVFTKGDSDD
jgi:hypothetical protein